MNQSRDLPGPAASAGSPWVADRGDGTYRNPVIYADYSDPDVIRVGADYWMTASSFSHVPGLPLLHSRDLVNWSLVNHALPGLTPSDHFSVPRHGAGVWAPAIRHHEGRYWIYYPDPDFGIFAVTAEDPRAAWSSPICVKAGKGLIDPCPFWDEDGTGYLIHGWAKSRCGISNRLTLHRMHPTGRSLADDGTVIVEGRDMPGWDVIEGPKIHKRGPYYYVFAPAGGVTDGYQAVFRSREIYGPYESRIVLDRGGTAINGPHQGAWVETPEGQSWFFHFQEIAAYGRVVHLQPMRWREDGWPEMGGSVDARGKGEPVLVHRKPSCPECPIAEPATSDEFQGPGLGLQWQWQCNPRPEWASVPAGSGVLRMRCVPAGTAPNLWSAGSLLMQKFPAPEFSVTTRLRFSPERDGDCAGLIVFGYDYAWIGLRVEGGALRVVSRRCLDSRAGGSETESFGSPAPAGAVWLRLDVGAQGRCSFSYRFEGGGFRAAGGDFQAKSGHWVGAKMGLFASASGANPSVGAAEFEAFRVGAAGS